MENIIQRHFIRFTSGLIMFGFCLLLAGAPFVQSFISVPKSTTGSTDQLINDLERLGLLSKLSEQDIATLINFQEERETNLGQILRDPIWRKKLGLQGETFKATWYMSNPFELLPKDLQRAITNKKIPFQSRTHVWEWCRKNNVSAEWRKALYAALIETTPQNLWRASQGQRSYTKNGEFLEPIIIDHGNGQLEFRDGHIATDPRVIPTNTEMFIIVNIEGVDRILKVKAADIGGAIKGRHVDLPIQVSPEAALMPHTELPKDKIRNRTIEILIPAGTSLSQKV